MQTKSQAVNAASASKPPVGAKVAKKAPAKAVRQRPESPADSRSKAVYKAMEALLEHGSQSNSALLQSIACLSGEEFLQVKGRLEHVQACNLACVNWKT